MGTLSHKTNEQNEAAANNKSTAPESPNFRKNRKVPGRIHQNGQRSHLEWITITKGPRDELKENWQQRKQDRSRLNGVNKTTLLEYFATQIKPSLQPKHADKWKRKIEQSLGNDDHSRLVHIPAKIQHNQPCKNR